MFIAYILQEKITAYNSRILQSGVELLTDAWQTTEFEIEAQLQAPFMRCVQLPKFEHFEPNEVKMINQN